MYKVIANLKFKRFVLWSIFFLIIFISLLLLWSFSLFDQMDYITTKRILDKPCIFYSESKKIVSGMLINREKFVKMLINREYIKVDKYPEKEGEFFIENDSTLDVFLRSFKYPGGEFQGRIFKIYFSDNKIKDIQDIKDNKYCDEIWFEPKVFGDLSGESVNNRPWITLNQVPNVLKMAILITEDQRFYKHPGVDTKSLLRALWINLKRRGFYQGGSTLTQQLVKNAFLNQKKTIKRKLVEAILALAMEIRYSKDKILEFYINQIYLGQNGAHAIYGVEDASLSYFGKHVWDLSVSECALITGIIPSPNKNNPRLFPEKALERRNHILNILFTNGKIDSKTYEDALNEKINLKPLDSQLLGDYYLSWISGILFDEIGIESISTPGYKIYTAMDIDMQYAAEKTLLNQDIEGALVAIDPFTGFIKALVGGKDFRKSQFNRATNAYRHPGSAFKPIIFATALEYKLITLATILEDTPLKVISGKKIWEPKNYDGKFLGKITARDAMVYSRNIPCIKVLEQVGINAVSDMAYSMGIQSRIYQVPSLALGTSEVTPLELTVAYVPFVNGGFAIKPIGIRWITDSQGRIIKEYLPESSQAISSETAALITDVLQDVINRGTGKNVRLLGFTDPVAGKTGTSDNFLDAWFIGYTPELVCGVWLGNDIPVSLGKSAAEIAIPVWVSFMNQIKEKEYSKKFERNPNIIEVTIDPESGLKARVGCKNRKIEYFLDGTEPKEYCNLHPGGIKGLIRRLFGGNKNDK